MKARFKRLRQVVTTFLTDTTGVILPYVALMMVVFVGLGALALDGGRYMSMQTQMQAMADAYALAGARELNQRSSAVTRATNAINNLVTTNGLSGLGYSGSFTHSVTFYSALNAANTGGGSTTSDDVQAKFVEVTVNPVTIPTIMPISFFKSGGTDSISAGARAIAGFTSQTFCDIPPVFICNPYETSGMSDSQATAALISNLALTSVQRQQVRLDPTKTGPGQFGYLVPPDGCNGASCLEDWIAQAKPKSCYQKASVDLNTGFKNSVTNGFNVRFDMYVGNLKKDQGNASYAPALNVRKGYTATGGNWCNANPANPYLNSAPTQTVAIYPNNTTTTATGTFASTGNNTCSGNNPSAKCVVTSVSAAIVAQVKAWLTASPVTIIAAGHVNAGSTVTTACTATDAAVANSRCGHAGANTLIMAAPATSAGPNVNIIVGLQTSGLPMDTNLVGPGNTTTFGNGQWDCESYWRINHGGAAPPGDMGGVCSTPANTTVSRYQVYLYENAVNSRITDYSLPASAAAGGESGAPLCNGSGVGPSPTQTDRRLIFSAVINCLAQGPFGGGSTANNIPVAGFAKFFMSQPVGADGTSYIYGEMSGLVGSLDEVRILNQVQLYR